MNIDELCKFLRVLEGEGRINQKIPPNASIISVIIFNGAVEVNYEYKYDGEHYSYITCRFPCEKANNMYFVTMLANKAKFAHIGNDGKFKSGIVEEELDPPKKDVKSLFRKKVK